MCVNDSFQFSVFAVHTDLDSFSCQHEKLFGKVQKFFIQKISPFLIGSNLSANSSQPTGASFKIYGNNIFGRCEQFTIELTMDISSQQQRKEVIFQARFVKIMQGKTWDRPLTNCLRRRSYTLQIWKDVEEGSLGNLFTEYSEEFSFTIKHVKMKKWGKQ